MCDICSDWKSGKIDAKQAFARIKDVIDKKPNNKVVGHLTTLSATILDKEVPMSEVDEESDRQWQDELYEDK